MSNKPLFMLLAVVLIGCEPSELRPVPVGGGPVAPAVPAQPVRPPAEPLAPPISPMLQDPDAKLEEWEEDIFADSLSGAEMKCQRLAEKMSREGGTVVVSAGVRQVSGKLYKCKFSSEVRNE